MIICSEEELYVLRLADVIADREELDLQVQVCTSFEQAERLEEFQGAELLLIGDEIPYEKRQMSRAARRFVLTSQEGTEVGEEEIPIYKYQSVRRIFAQIVETCLDQDNAGLFLVPRKGGRRLIVVYSPIHRIGKTRFAKALGHVLSRKEIRLGGKSASLADLLYYSRQEQNHLGLRLASMVKEEDGLAVLDPIPVSLDLKEVAWEDWNSLILQILKKGPYQNLILDVSESVQGLFDILKICDVWYLPYIESVEVMGYKKLSQKARMTEMKGEPEICVKKALQYEKNTAYGDVAESDHGKAGSVEGNRRWRTGRIDLSGIGRVRQRYLSSTPDEDGIW